MRRVVGGPDALRIHDPQAAVVGRGRMTGEHQDDLGARLEEAADEAFGSDAEPAANVGRELPPEHEDAHGEKLSALSCQLTAGVELIADS